MEHSGICAAILFVSVAGWANSAEQSIQPIARGPALVRPSAEVPPVSLNITELVLVDDDCTTITKEISQKLRTLLTSKNFSELDKMAAGFRTSKAQTANGSWHLGIFYSEMAQCNAPVAEADRKARIELLGEWVRARPDSITARVALADIYISYAWDARGDDYADTVTDAGWRLFKLRLQQAQDILTQARKLQAKCPAWWNRMQVVARGLEWDSVAYDRLFREAVAFEPDYSRFYKEKAEFLLPRWYGREGDWQKFAAEAANKLDGEAGDILYARIGWYMHERRIYKGFIRDSGYSWDRMRKGLEAICKRYPRSLTPVSELAYLAYQIADRRSAQALYERLGKNVDTGIWGDDRPRFLRARAWAFGAENPMSASVQGELAPPPVPGLVLKGISGPPDRRFCIINDRTFGNGETSTIKVGQKSVSIKCLQIKERSAIILVDENPRPWELTGR